MRPEFVNPLTTLITKSSMLVMHHGIDSDGSLAQPQDMTPTIWLLYLRRSNEA